MLYSIWILFLSSQPVFTTMLVFKFYMQITLLYLAHEHWRRPQSTRTSCWVKNVGSNLSHFSGSGVQIPYEVVYKICLVVYKIYLSLNLKTNFIFNFLTWLAWIALISFMAPAFSLNDLLKRWGCASLGVWNSCYCWSGAVFMSFFKKTYFRSIIWKTDARQSSILLSSNTICF